MEVTEKYTVSKLLGRGACGEVRLVFERHSCRKYAMKIVQKKTFSISSKLGETFTKRIQSEVDILMRLSHPCVIFIYEVVNVDDALYMILELIIRLGHLSETDSKFLFLQMVYAVKYLHKNGITHRDLKPENILLSGPDNRCLIKVTDFGLSKLVDGNTMLRTFCGTPTYLAPEVLKTAGSGTYTSAIDIWSLGVILFICLVGYPPFTDERQDHDLQTQIIRGLYDFPDVYWGEISDDAKSLICGMLAVEPSDRLTIQAVLDHPWLQDPSVRTEVDALIAEEKARRPILISTGPSQPYFSELSNSSKQDAVTPISAMDITDHASNGDDNILLSNQPLIRKRPSEMPYPVHLEKHPAR
ncbi:Ovarian-specific serine/threonine-protein kinase Lok [Fasciola hepatica]|uniref:Ovarian-specific serine/threonine-protein kinase Lok n=1 Tax=Fasciola hepatica TaxID=6192 RepID=A0A4E0RT95_FASHE|nr:Ovarian-specific serine/threonine-protein kinase Lok [Fasciola hepatica]